MATSCEIMEAEPATVKAYIDGLSLTTHNIIATCVIGQKVIVFVDGT